ncbi:MAG: hypothetical protein MI974_20910 [Chitinophagales bacterium]|nr:hypothetical protein [Chitinophagales bacterium]
MSTIIKFIGILSIALLPALSKAQNHTITFYANTSQASLKHWAGHVWVSLSNGSQATKIGFYPEGLENESKRKADLNYTFSISKSAYNNALGVIKHYNDYPYILGLHDCRSFASDMAEAVGLDVPSQGLKSPAEWLADLVEEN